MRLLAVRLQNLNSLSGTHEVRFDVAPLSAAGVFLITGPTGAGKSTLLDAMTLATTTDMTVDQVKARLLGNHVSDAIAVTHTQHPSRSVPEAPSEAAPAALAVADVSGLWDQALRSRGMALQGDAPTSAASNSPSPATPDWGSTLKSRGMAVA